MHTSRRLGATGGAARGPAADSYSRGALPRGGAPGVAPLPFERRQADMEALTASLIEVKTAERTLNTVKAELAAATAELDMEANSQVAAEQELHAHESQEAALREELEALERELALAQGEAASLEMRADNYTEEVVHLQADVDGLDRRVRFELPQELAAATEALRLRVEALKHEEMVTQIRVDRNEKTLLEELLSLQSDIGELESLAREAEASLAAPIQLRALPATLLAGSMTQQPGGTKSAGLLEGNLAAPAIINSTADLEDEVKILRYSASFRETRALAAAAGEVREAATTAERKLAAKAARAKQDWAAMTTALGRLSREIATYTQQMAEVNSVDEPDAMALLMRTKPWRRTLRALGLPLPPLPAAMREEGSSNNAGGSASVRSSSGRGGIEPGADLLALAAADDDAWLSGSDSEGEGTASGRTKKTGGGYYDEDDDDDSLNLQLEALHAAIAPRAVAMRPPLPPTAVSSSRPASDAGSLLAAAGASDGLDVDSAIGAFRAARNRAAAGVGAPAPAPSAAAAVRSRLGLGGNEGALSSADDIRLDAVSPRTARLIRRALRGGEEAETYDDGVLLVRAAPPPRQQQGEDDDVSPPSPPGSAASSSSSVPSAQAAAPPMRRSAAASNVHKASDLLPLYVNAAEAGAATLPRGVVNANGTVKPSALAALADHDAEGWYEGLEGDSRAGHGDGEGEADGESLDARSRSRSRLRKAVLNDTDTTSRTAHMAKTRPLGTITAPAPGGSAGGAKGAAPTANVPTRPGGFTSSFAPGPSRIPRPVGKAQQTQQSQSAQQQQQQKQQGTKGSTRAAAAAAVAARGRKGGPSTPPGAGRRSAAGASPDASGSTPPNRMNVEVYDLDPATAALLLQYVSVTGSPAPVTSRSPKGGQAALPGAGVDSATTSPTGGVGPSEAADDGYSYGGGALSRRSGEAGGELEPDSPQSGSSGRGGGGSGGLSSSAMARIMSPTSSFAAALRYQQMLRPGLNVAAPASDDDAGSDSESGAATLAPARRVVKSIPLARANDFFTSGLRDASITASSIVSAQDVLAASSAASRARQQQREAAAPHVPTAAVLEVLGSPRPAPPRDHASGSPSRSGLSPLSALLSEHHRSLLGLSPDDPDLPAAGDDAEEQIMLLQALQGRDGGSIFFAGSEGAAPGKGTAAGLQSPRAARRAAAAAAKPGSAAAGKPPASAAAAARGRSRGAADAAPAKPASSTTSARLAALAQPRALPSAAPAEPSASSASSRPVSKSALRRRGSTGGERQASVDSTGSKRRVVWADGGKGGASPSGSSLGGGSPAKRGPSEAGEETGVTSPASAAAEAAAVRLLEAASAKRAGGGMAIQRPAVARNVTETLVANELPVQAGSYAARHAFSKAKAAGSPPPLVVEGVDLTPLVHTVSTQADVIEKLQQKWAEAAAALREGAPLQPLQAAEAPEPSPAPAPPAPVPSFAPPAPLPPPSSSLDEFGLGGSDDEERRPEDRPVDSARGTGPISGATLSVSTAPLNGSSASPRTMTVPATPAYRSALAAARNAQAADAARAVRGSPGGAAGRLELGDVTMRLTPPLPAGPPAVHPLHGSVVLPPPVPLPPWSHPMDAVHPVSARSATLVDPPRPRTLSATSAGSAASSYLAGGPQQLAALAAFAGPDGHAEALLGGLLSAPPPPPPPPARQAVQPPPLPPQGPARGEPAGRLSLDGPSGGGLASPAGRHMERVLASGPAALDGAAAAQLLEAMARLVAAGR